MNDNVIILPVITTLDIPASRVLNGALAADLDSCIVIGYNKDGSEYFSSSKADGADVLWMMERAKLNLLYVEVKDG